MQAGVGADVVQVPVRSSLPPRVDPGVALVLEMDGKRDQHDITCVIDWLRIYSQAEESEAFTLQAEPSNGEVNTDGQDEKVQNLDRELDRLLHRLTALHADLDGV